LAEERFVGAIGAVAVASMAATTRGHGNGSRLRPGGGMDLRAPVTPFILRGDRGAACVADRGERRVKIVQDLSTKLGHDQA
jgi:hypothetical protein